MKYFLRFGTYTMISSITLLGIINQQFRILCLVLVVGYMIYAGSDTYMTAVKHYEERNDFKRSLIYAIAHNSMDFGLFVLSIIVSIFLAIS